jgi:alpha-tubulin suppressor-like RCC1 family protein
MFGPVSRRSSLLVWVSPALLLTGCAGLLGDDPPAPPPRPWEPARVAGIVASAYSTCSWSAARVDCWGRICKNGRGRQVCAREGMPFAGVEQVVLRESDFGVDQGLDLCALHHGGSVSCWRLGASDLSPKDLPPVKQLAAGGEHLCARLVSGEVRCWGKNVQGQLGVSAAGVESDLPLAVPGIADATDVEARDNDTCVARQDRSIWCWGWDFNTSEPKPLPDVKADVIALGSLRHSLDASLAHGLRSRWEGGTRCILQDGAPSCWGPNLAAGVGDGTTEFRDAAVPVLRANGAPFGGVVSLALGLHRSCALVRDGAVLCWGDTSPRPDAGRRGHPERIGNLSAVRQIVSGQVHQCALLADGTVQCWGSNEHNQIGPGAGSYEESPVPLLW